MLIQGVVCKASHAFKSSLFFLFDSYISLLDPGHTVKIFVWFCLLDDSKRETESFPAGISRAAEAAKIRGEDVLQPTSSGRTTAQGDIKQRQENSRKRTENASES